MLPRLACVVRAIIAANSFAYDAARWRAGDAAVALGYDDGTLDAGYEWVGWHATEGGNADGADALTWYEDGVAKSRPCAVISNSPIELDGFALLREDRSAYLQYLFFGTEQPLYLYGSAAPGCPPLPAAHSGSGNTMAAERIALRDQALARAPREPHRHTCILRRMLGWIRRRDVIALGALRVAGVGIPLWLAAAAGAIGLPNGDDWVYKQGADSLFRTGSIDMPGHTTAAIGQILMAQPFLALSGGDPWAFTAFGLVMAFIGITSTYLLARRFTGTGAAVLVVLLVVAIPGFAREPTGFNTDGPAFALEMLCLLLGVSWLQGSGGRLTLAVAIGWASWR